MSLGKNGQKKQGCLSDRLNPLFFEIQSIISTLPIPQMYLVPKCYSGSVSRSPFFSFYLAHISHNFFVGLFGLFCFWKLEVSTVYISLLAINAYFILLKYFI